MKVLVASTAAEGISFLWVLMFFVAYWLKFRPCGWIYHCPVDKHAYHYAFHKHANAAFTIAFFAAVNHNYDHKQRTWKHGNTQNGSKSTNCKSQTMTFWTRWRKVLFPKRSVKMIDGSEKRYCLILVNNGTFRKMSIIEMKIFINSHCANIDPKIFFICALHTFLVQILVMQKTLRGKRQF